MSKALVIDDERDICELIAMSLIGQKIVCENAHTLKQAAAKLRTNDYQLVICDIRLPDGDGLDFLAMMQRKYPEIPVCIITAHGNMDMAVRALRLGAFDFLNKPLDLSQLRDLCKAATREHAQRRSGESATGDAQARAPEKNTPKTGYGLIGSSQAMQNVRSIIAKVAKAHAAVFIQGESGTGKEVIARLIHAQSARCEGPFIAVNCAAIPENLVESELFGYKKGAFTGAERDRDGLFVSANGGTLFLDEVADLPLAMQVKLLRAIQERAVRPVGGKDEEPVDIRIISATHKNLALNVREGHFREDLFYRLDVIHIDVPPLRERLEDIPELAEFLLKRLSARHPESHKVRLDAQACAVLRNYDYPGNVRELENIIERALTFCEGDTIGSADLQLESRSPSKTLKPQEDEDPPLPQDLESYMGSIEKDLLTRALEESGNNKTLAAKRLGISFRAIRYKLKKWGLD